VNILRSPSSSESHSAGLGEEAFLTLKSFKTKRPESHRSQGQPSFTEKLDLQNPRVLLHKITHFPRDSFNNKTNFPY